MSIILANGGRSNESPPKSERSLKTRRAPGPSIQTPQLRFIDLFCGIGGFRLAFERAGARCVFSSDWDKFSQQTYEANFGEKPQGDITSIPVADIPPFDILCGGFPCQPFSLAGVSKKNSLGRKHGFEDERQANLFLSIATVLEHHEPIALEFSTDGDGNCFHLNKQPDTVQPCETARRYKQKRAANPADYCRSWLRSQRAHLGAEMRAMLKHLLLQ